jgi:hypothetical protein
MTDTVRQTVMAYLTNQFKTIVAGSPGGDPYTVQWTRVENAPFEYTAGKKAFALVIQDVTEKKVQEIGIYDCTMKVVFEFYAYTATDSDRSAMGRIILGEIERRIGEDPSLGGHAITMYETANDVKVDSPDVHEICGVVYYDLRYRHSIRDPRKVA